jgi:hypothetical protein
MMSTALAKLRCRLYVWVQCPWKRSRNRTGREGEKRGIVEDTTHESVDVGELGAEFGAELLCSTTKNLLERLDNFGLSFLYL